MATLIVVLLIALFIVAIPVVQWLTQDAEEIDQPMRFPDDEDSGLP